MRAPNRCLQLFSRPPALAKVTVIALLVGLVLPAGGCFGGGRKGQLQDRKNTLADELRDLVPAVLAAKKKARPILAKRRLGNTAMSMRGGNVDGATFNFTSVHAGVNVRGTIRAQATNAPRAAATIKVSKSGRRGGRR